MLDRCSEAAVPQALCRGSCASGAILISVVVPSEGDDGELWVDHPADAAASITLVQLESVYSSVKNKMCTLYTTHHTAHAAKPKAQYYPKGHPYGLDRLSSAWGVPARVKGALSRTATRSK